MRMTPDVPMPSEDYAEGFAAGMASLRMIRCVKHRGVLPYNANEIGGGECAACEIDAKNAEIRGLVNQKWVRKEDHDALRANCERMREVLSTLEFKAEAWEDDELIITMNGNPIGYTLSKGDARVVSGWLRRLKAALLSRLDAAAGNAGEVQP